MNYLLRGGRSSSYRNKLKPWPPPRHSHPKMPELQPSQSFCLSPKASSRILLRQCNRSWSMCPRPVHRKAGSLLPWSCVLHPISPAPTVKVQHTISNTLLQEHVDPLLGGLPPGSNGTNGRLATAKVGQLLECVVQNVLLLLNGHGYWVLYTSVSNRRCCSRRTSCE
jgi:hypothetical protein